MRQRLPYAGNDSSNGHVNSTDAVGFTQEELDHRKAIITVKRAMGFGLTEVENTIVNYENGMRCHACSPSIAMSRPSAIERSPSESQN